VRAFKAGSLVPRGGYSSFEPTPLAREWRLDDMGLINLLGQADRELGRLDIFSEHIPDVDLFIRMHVLKEATQSTRIEGTQTNMDEALRPKADVAVERRDDWEEVHNYVAAMNDAIKRLAELPLSSRLIRETHAILMKGVRGRDKLPGEFRKSQNWIGGASIKDAVFIPPAHVSVPGLMADLERFIHDDRHPFPEIMKAAIVHYQFETIHPFLDGNGRLGRLLLVFFLIVHGRLGAPLLYLSSYLERERRAYYRALQTIQETGNPLPWFELFLTAIEVEAHDAVARAQQIIELRQRYRQAATTMGTANGLALVDLICANPLVTTRLVEERLGVSRPTALRLLSGLEQRGVLTEAEAGARGQRRYAARELMAVLTGEGEPN
jgi:Fic family protein